MYAKSMRFNLGLNFEKHTIHKTGAILLVLKKDCCHDFASFEQKTSFGENLSDLVLNLRGGAANAM